MQQRDIMEQVGQYSVAQHGYLNNRIYLLKLDPRDMPQVVDELDRLAVLRGYAKIFAKVPENLVHHFTEAGYNREAFVPGYYGGKLGVVFLGKYFDDARRELLHSETIKNNLKLAADKAAAPIGPMPEGYELREAVETDIEEICAVYRDVFQTYPFPIHQPSYIRQTMQSNVDYFIARDPTGRLAAVSSAEKDVANGNCEMTDFATLPTCRGKSIASHLLRLMEEIVPNRGICTAYTIARAMSAGMNITFAKAGYTFSGTLIQNTCISGEIESMNVWYKPAPLTVTR